MKRSWIIALLIALLLGAVLAPVTAYMVGGRMIGPYPGSRGIASYFGAIYGDAVRGKPFALWILLGPAVAVCLWWLRSALLAAARKPGNARN